LKVVRQLQIKPSIIALTGLSVSGKSTLGAALAKDSNTVWLDVDTARKKIDAKSGWRGPEQEKEIMLRAYARNHALAKRCLGEGKPIALCATYSRKTYHDMLRQLRDSSGVPLFVYLLELSDEVAEGRLAQRRKEKSLSNVTTREAYLEQKHRYIPFPGGELTVLDGSRPVLEQAERVFEEITSAGLLSK
jgi:predicted kinase